MSSIDVGIDEAEIQWHSVSVEEIFEMQASNISGLVDSEVRDRLVRFGRNALTPPKKTTLLIRLFQQINNILIYILLIVALVSGVLGEWAEVCLIVAVIALNVSIGLVQEGKAEKATEAIKNMLSAKATVVRNSVQQDIDGALLVPGDIVVIKAGDCVPADMRLFETMNLKILESVLTGESNPVRKHADIIPSGRDVAIGDRRNIAFSATMVQVGQGKGIVVSTGDLTEIGKIGSLVSQQKTVKTNLIIQLEIFGRYISAFIIVVSLVTFCLAYLKAQVPAGEAFNSATAIAVAMIPEGLPAVVTISLALATQILVKNNAIVKQLPAIETLGSVSVICSDKTGTLTKNEMTVTKIFTLAATYRVHGVGYSPDQGYLVGADGVEISADSKAKLLHMFGGIVLCNDAEFRISKSEGGGMEFAAVGYPTEVALLVLGMKLGIRDLARFRESRQRLATVPFSSELKFMCTIHKEGPKAILHIKGAPENIFLRCRGQVVNDDLTTSAPFEYHIWEEAVSELSREGLRCLAVAFADWPESMDVSELNAEYVLQPRLPWFTLVGLVGIIDPPREEAVDACAIARKAGIQVKMITGDHPLTASAIAKQLGIIPADISDEGIVVMTGPQLDRICDADLDRCVLDCHVFARASPENKIKIVKSLQRVGQICSMTGDGVNDAPALKAADIGIAMGITGTDVAKEAARMILVDDNFSTIIAAVREGRRVWDNLVKILWYNMPVNFAQGFSVFFAYVMNFDKVPLTAIQVLYINMITSVTMGLMLAMEPSEEGIMQRPPRRQGKRLFGRMVIWHCLFVASILVVCVLVVFKLELEHWSTLSMSSEGSLKEHRRSEASLESVKHARAAAFNMLVFGEAAYALNCRFIRESSISLKTITGNHWCWVSIIITVVLQVVFTHVPVINEFFSNAPLGIESWGRLLGLSVAIFILVEIEKYLGPRYVMPILHLIGLFRPTFIERGENMANADLNSFIIFASGASATGLPVPHSRGLQTLVRTSSPVRVIHVHEIRMDEQKSVETNNLRPSTFEAGECP